MKIVQNLDCHCVHQQQAVAESAYQELINQFTRHKQDLRNCHSTLQEKCAGCVSPNLTFHGMLKTSF